MKNLHFGHLLQAGERIFFHTIAHNRWEVINLKPVQEFEFRLQKLKVVAFERQQQNLIYLRTNALLALECASLLSVATRRSSMALAAADTAAFRSSISLDSGVHFLVAGILLRLSLIT